MSENNVEFKPFADVYREGQRKLLEFEHEAKIKNFENQLNKTLHEITILNGMLPEECDLHLSALLRKDKTLGDIFKDNRGYLLNTKLSFIMSINLKSRENIIKMIKSRYTAEGTYRRNNDD
jgi:hypothetical protein